MFSSKADHSSAILSGSPSPLGSYGIGTQTQDFLSKTTAYFMTSPCVSYRSDNAINRNPCFLCLLFRLFSGAESAGAVRSLPSPREFCFLVFIIVFVVFTLHGGIALTLHSYLHGGIGLLKIIKMGFEVI